MLIMRPLKVLISRLRVRPLLILVSRVSWNFIRVRVLSTLTNVLRVRSERSASDTSAVTSGKGKKAVSKCCYVCTCKCTLGIFECLCSAAICLNCYTAV